MLHDVVSAATTNPSSATIDDILRDSAAFTSSAIAGIGSVAHAGVNLYNTMSNLCANPQGFVGQSPQMNMYQANTYSTIPQCPYAYAENVGGGGMGLTPFLNTMNPQMMAGGYPGFADPDYGNMSPMGFGFGGRL